MSEIHIPDSAEELCDSRLSECKSLSRVTFGESSSLKRISKTAFDLSRLKEIHVPSTVEGLVKNAVPSQVRIVTSV